MATEPNIKRHLYATNRIKASNESILYVIDTVNDAICKNRKLYFST